MSSLEASHLAQSYSAEALKKRADEYETIAAMHRNCGDVKKARNAAARYRVYAAAHAVKIAWKGA
jgi:hypothetical protein